MKRYILAPMDGLITSLTAFCLVLPVVFLAFSTAAVVGPVMAGTAFFLLALYAGIWLWWRPGSFSLESSGLRIKFPLRTITVPFEQVTGCEFWQKEDLKARYGFTYRVGAGGLWGGFGWLRSSTNKEWIEFYISRQSDYVFIERRDACPLLLTPERPAEFCPNSSWPRAQSLPNQITEEYRHCNFLVRPTTPS